jgi:methylmalonyl-CoA mutase
MKNLFQDFPENTLQDWLNQIQKDLKNNTLESITAKTYEGIDIPVALSQEHLDPNFVAYTQKICLNGISAWKNRVHFKVNIQQIVETNTNIKNALQNGADEVCIEMGENLFSIPELLQDITHTDFSKIYLYFNDFQAIEKFEAISKIPENIYFGGDFLSESLVSGEIKEYYFEKMIIYLNQPNFILQLNLQPYHNAGANAVQELAFGLCQMVEYLNNISDKGLNINKIIEKLEISVAIGSAYFMEIAKLRALKVLFHQLFTHFGVVQPNICLHTRTSTWNKTQKDAYNNMLKTTTEAMAGILGGSHSLTIDTYDDTFSVSNEFSQRIARNTLLLLREESYFGKVSEIASGSYLIEYLTHQLTQKAWALFQETEKQGGFIQTIENQFIKNEITEVQQQKIKDFQDKKLILTGVNKYPNPKEVEKLDRNEEISEKSKNTYLNLQRLETYL